MGRNLYKLTKRFDGVIVIVSGQLKKWKVFEDFC